MFIEFSLALPSHSHHDHLPQNVLYLSIIYATAKMLYYSCIIDVGWYYLSKLQTLSHDSLFEHGAEVLGISRTSLVQSYHMVKHVKTSSSLRGIPERGVIYSTRRRH